MTAQRTLSISEFTRIGCAISEAGADYGNGIPGVTEADIAAFWLQARPLHPYILTTGCCDCFCEGFAERVREVAVREALSATGRGAARRTGGWARLSRLAGRVSTLISLHLEGEISVSLPYLCRLRASFLEIVRDFDPARAGERVFRATEEAVESVIEEAALEEAAAD